ncbi:MAG: NACHT domain-containing protein [Acidobacteriaceae bacterium]
MNREQLLADLAPFADIGDSAVKISEQAKKFIVRLTREGRELKVVVDKESGKITGTWGKLERSFANLHAMLASDIFANLRRWADAQRELLRRETPSPDKLLPTYGVTHGGQPLQSIEEFDELLGTAQRPDDTTEVLLIDGPAGIGKTNLIQQLALRRAEIFKTSSKPVILHVKSRGRVLSNLQDLMAFSLQTIRSSITYDQVPVLAKHGLLVIAIDGFDELADPNGYEMAWAQLGELVTFLRGKGTLILAGRDTFIGRARLLKSVAALREGVDVVSSVTLRAPTPAQAKQWLTKRQWTEANFSLPSIAVLLEEDSFALRPIFLRIIADYVTPKELKDKHERYLTPLLVNQMVRREARLFGAPVESVMTHTELEKFLFEFLREVARQMADSQTESLDASEISWISEIALGEGKSAEVVGLIRNRASVVAFFINDERPGYKTFIHSYLLDYFVAIVAIEALAKSDVPKFIRRNLLGSEFLSIFADVAAEMAISSRPVFEAFWSYASTLPLSYTSTDRGPRNVGALVFASLSVVTREEGSVKLREFHVDDAVIRGTCSGADLITCEINQLDCRGADLSALTWVDSKIQNLLADDAVCVSPSFPVPTRITLPTGDQLSGADEVGEWLDKHGRNPEVTVASGLAPQALKSKPIYKLLIRAARMRQYWMRSGGDDFYAIKIINDPSWESLSKVLANHGYLREETRTASGRASKFYHIRHRESILAESPNDQNLKELFDDLMKA